MKFSWIENYAGTWQDDESRTLMITIRDDENATVDVLMHGAPMIRPWCGDEPAKGLPARYNPAEGPGLDVDLGRPGFSLNLNDESDHVMNPDEPESLSVGISRYDSDTEGEQYLKLFGKMGQYTRVEG